MQELSSARQRNALRSHSVHDPISMQKRLRTSGCATSARARSIPSCDTRGKNTCEACNRDRTQPETEQGVRAALDELQLLVNEYDPQNSDWTFRKLVMRSVIEKCRTPLPSEGAVAWREAIAPFADFAKQIPDSAPDAICIWPAGPSWSGGAIATALDFRRAAAFYASPPPASGPSDSVRHFAEVLRKWWSFDDNQQHTHSWHSREDFIKRELPKFLAAPPASAEVREVLEAALRHLDNSDSPGGCNGKHPECDHCATIAKVRKVIRALASGEKSEK